MLDLGGLAFMSGHPLGDNFPLSWLIVGIKHDLLTSRLSTTHINDYKNIIR